MCFRCQWPLLDDHADVIFVKEKIESVKGRKKMLSGTVAFTRDLITISSKALVSPNFRHAIRRGIK
ncbi:hypothetical protein ALC53_04590 [Atta colombica]|uniref:Uncharacterized protein n=1 Tax=Atta colombica TaxID=520822 RepID=A0A195BKY9_9HYME|nr:hypothetical protein ALC53_04590 [Atta colombica]